LPTPSAPPAFLSLGAWIGLSDGRGRGPGEDAVLLSPNFEYDVALNSSSCPVRCSAERNTQDGYARDLKAFLNFLWHNRNEQVATHYRALFILGGTFTDHP